ncbi:hypothetical protein [Halorussus caseinilyticus]|uniref:Uncharacterized protein n=1 Tax=Halorussus caseinilyticus TaxID=3034025 RepID=A0ABD5WPZ2_9EURY
MSDDDSSDAAQENKTQNPRANSEKVELSEKVARRTIEKGKK